MKVASAELDGDAITRATEGPVKVIEMASEKAEKDFNGNGNGSEDGDHDTDTAPSMIDSMIDWYAAFIAASPWRMYCIGLSVMIGFAILGVVVTTVFKGGLTIGAADDGFEARGSALADRVRTKSLIINAECSGKLSLKADGTPSKLYSKFVKQNSQPFLIPIDECYAGYEPASSRRLAATTSGELGELGEDNQRRQLAWGDHGVKYDPSLVGGPDSAITIAALSKTGVTIVFEGGDLFATAPIKGMCTADTHVQTSISVWPTLCIQSTNSACLPTRSLGNYVAALTNATSCSALTDSDVADVKSMLVQCRPYYDDGTLQGNCWDWEIGVNGTYTDKYLLGDTYMACTLPASAQYCARYNAAYDIFASLAEKNWLSGGSAALPLAQFIMNNQEEVDDQAVLFDAWIDVVEPMIGQNYGGAKATSASMFRGLRGQIFNLLIVEEMIIAVLVFVLVFFLILFHTGSLWIASNGFLQVFLAFFWGFTFYQVVLWRSFFPFLNLISLFLIIGIGADDLFVYLDAWKQSFSLLPRDTTLAHRISYTLKRAGGAMFVTTLTTTASFLANMITPITALKGFGLFTAMVILSDFLLMLIFIPAVVAVHHTTFSVPAGHVQLAAGKNPSWNKGMYGCMLPEESSPVELVSDGLDVEANNNNYNTTTNSNTDREGNQKVVTTAPGPGPLRPFKADGLEGDGGMEMVMMSSSKLIVNDSDPDNMEEAKARPVSVPGQALEVESGENGEFHYQQDCSREDAAEQCCCKNCFCCVTTCDIDFCAVPTEIDPATGRTKQRWSESFFEFKVAPTLLHNYGRFGFLLFCLGMTIYFTTYALQLQRPSSDYMQLLEEDNVLEQYVIEYSMILILNFKQVISLYG